MRVPSIRTSFGGYGDPDLLNKSGDIVLSMTDNPFFPTPVPPLADVQEALGIYGNALTAAQALGRDKVAAKNQARKNLEQLLGQLGRYVMYVANGDENILISSGFTLAKEPQPRYLDNPGNVTLAQGISAGQVVSTVAKGNASSYVHEITDTLPTEATVWTSYATTTRKFVFKNLIPGKQYWVRVAAVGNRGQLAYSTIATIFAQLS